MSCVKRGGALRHQIAMLVAQPLGADILRVDFDATGNVVILVKPTEGHVFWEGVREQAGAETEEALAGKDPGQAD